MGKKRILIITYYWPPSGGVGVQRWMHFTKHLKERGWEPVIYTPSNPQFDVQDSSLNKFVEDIEVIKKPIWEPFSLFHKITGNKNKENVKQGLVLEKSKKGWMDNLMVWIRGNLFVPDPRVFWVKPSVLYLAKKIPKLNVDTIITTGPPHSMHLIGLGIKKKLPGIKWLADFRDPWSEWDVLPKLKTGALAMRRHRKLESKVLLKADKVTTVSSRLARSLAMHRMGWSVDVLLNGISDDRVKQHAQNSKNQAEKFTIGYYGMLNELRDPESVWESLEILSRSNNQFDSSLEIRIGGIVSQYIQEKLEKSEELGNKTKFLGYLSHEEVFKEYDRCDILLLLLNQSDNAKWILPMKFFEYLSAGKPILCLGPKDSDLAEFFKGRKIGKMFEFHHQNEISNFILATFDGVYKPEMNDFADIIKTCTRSHQTDRLVDLLEDL